MADDRLQAGIERALSERDQYPYDTGYDSGYNDDVYETTTSPDVGAPGYISADAELAQQVRQMYDWMTEFQQKQAIKEETSRRFSETKTKIKELLQDPRFEQLKPEEDKILQEIEEVYNAGVAFNDPAVPLAYFIGRKYLESLQNQQASQNQQVQQENKQGNVPQQPVPSYVPLSPTQAGGSPAVPSQQDMKGALKDMSAEQIAQTFGNIAF